MRQPFQGQPWHSERWRVNSQDSHRKSKAKKPNDRTQGGGGKKNNNNKKNSRWKEKSSPNL